jgi:hypothetical protein
VPREAASLFASREPGDGGLLEKSDGDQENTRQHGSQWAAERKRRSESAGGKKDEDFYKMEFARPKSREERMDFTIKSQSNCDEVASKLR